MSTPSKRRRTSPSTYVAVNGDSDDNAAKSGPATPKRASYLSPTKASLARSNPVVLAQTSDAKARRESSPNRRRSLRDAVLGARVDLLEEDERQQEVGQTADVETSTNEQQAGVSSSNQLATDIAKAFEQPANSDIPAPIQPRSPLRIRQPSLQPSIYTPPRNRSVPSVTTPSIVPKLVQSTSKIVDDERNDRQDTEGELPLTIVRLGKDVAGRPRGLVSSSPGGSDRRRVRGPNRTTTSSPLKPRDPPPEQSEDAVDNVEVASGLGEEPEEEGYGNKNAAADEYFQEEVPETTEDAGDHAEEQSQDDLDDPVIRDKMSELKVLQDQLQVLQTDCRELERLGTTITKLNTKTSDLSTLEPTLELLLSSASKSIDPRNPPLESHPLFQKDPTAFLTLFAPGNLIMSYETWEKQVRGRQKFVYQTTFAAPRPWPPTALNITFETTIDLEDDAVEKIEFNNTSNRPMSASIEKWINDRLADPVLGCDLATLVTGVGRHFEEDVRRARVLKDLAERYPTVDVVLTSSDSVESISLLPYLGKSQMSFISDEEARQQQRTRRSASTAMIKEVMLVYNIHLNWIGQPKTSVDVVIAGFSYNAMHNAKKLFREIEPISGVVKAFEAVWEVLGMDNKEERERGDESVGLQKGDMSKGKGKARKSLARRMTEFN
ncbi:hypothetical protein H2198_007946 [Neophaeococcomyces mojaviensis]|uniref:Uncharacterized protein n=1 Tax=Neophaeococcomyces mojaviensis TaxID=3383035 RepID=A0ACC2ZYL1_9EURO|nr:hypothetical protein H2198_007946 [Knufia sp. JES_112]